MYVGFGIFFWSELGPPKIEPVGTGEGGAGSGALCA